MEYDLGSVQNLFGVISGQLQNISRDCSCSSTIDLCVENIGTQNNEYLSQKLLACVQLLDQCQISLKVSSVEIDKLKNTVISLQGERIAETTTACTASPQQIGASSWSHIVEKNSAAPVVSRQFTTVTPVRGNPNYRDQNVMLFGVAEQKNEITDEVVSDLFSQMGEKPHYVDCARVGRNESAVGKPRPIKVKMRNADSAAQTITNGKKLHGNTETEGIYVGPDRTPEQREERRRLVAIIKERRKSDPSHFHFIDRRTVLSRDRYTLASESPEPEGDTNVSDSKGMASFFIGLLDKSKQAPRSRSASDEC